MDHTQSNLFPALRAKMGDRWYYITTLTLAEVAQWIRPVDDIHERAELKTWIQRALRPERKDQIASYLRTKPDRFFNAVVAGIYGGEPEWFPVDVQESLTVTDVALGERQSASFGFLRLSGGEDVFAIDGQHRVEGIRQAIAVDQSLRDEELSVIFVSHKSTDEGRERTRRLFTTLNKYAKPVSTAELIALNDDDTFAIVTRQLIESYPGLGPEFVPLAPSANIPAGNHTCITTVIGLYELVSALAVPASSRERRKLKEGPAEQRRVDEVHKILVRFWNGLRRNVPVIRNVCASSPDKEIAGTYRHDDGGHVLLRPAGLQAFAAATRVMVDRGTALGRAIAQLSALPLELSADPWLGVLWNPVAKTMIVRNRKLATNLFLHYLGERLQPETYRLLAQYRRATGDPGALFPEL
jgi:DNA sulfur modification protein DndB